MGILNNKLFKSVCFAWLDKTRNGNSVFYKEKSYRIKKANKHKRIFLVNTPEYANIGDQLITVGEMCFLKEHFPESYVYEITQTYLLSDWDGFKAVVRDDDIILVTGGGFMGSVWQYSENLVRKIAEEFSCPVVIMPQTAFFSNDETGKMEYENSRKIYSKKKNLYAVAREKSTYEVFKAFVGEERTLLLPDMAVHAANEIGINSFEKNTDVTFCFRTDREAVLASNVKGKVVEAVNRLNLTSVITDTVLENNILYAEDRMAEVMKMAHTIGKSKLLITDRLHAMVFAILTNTNCIAFDNSTKKVSGVYEILQKFGISGVTLISKTDADSIDYEQLVKKLINEGCTNVYNFKLMYEPLAKLIKDLINDEC